MFPNLYVVACYKTGDAMRNLFSSILAIARSSETSPKRGGACPVWPTHLQGTAISIGLYFIPPGAIFIVCNLIADVEQGWPNQATLGVPWGD
jgi:hypothetical protein